MHRLMWLGAALLAGLSFGAGAQTLKPGLWEVSNNMKTSSGEMEKGMAQMQAQMAAMTPEQRKMMEGMMAKQGVGIGAGAAGAAPGAMLVKMCITREMAERNEIGGREGDCKSNYSPRTGNTMKYGFTCANPPSSGQGEFTFVGAEAYRSKMTTTSTRGGKPEKMDMDGQGKWLAADCGSIKPLSVKK